MAKPLFPALYQALRPAFTGIINAIYPPRCLVCGAALADQAGLCVMCWSALEIPGIPACRLCQRPFADYAPADGLCSACRHTPPAHDGIAAATRYTPVSRQLVLALKYGRKLALAPVMARLMAARIGQIPAPPPDAPWLLVPVPLHRWRLWRRGYNQSAVLAGELARLTGARLLVDALCRTKHTPSLGRLSRQARAMALSGAITPHPRHAQRLAGANVILVDDVLTSGATSGACVSALRQAGARRVVITCFARVLD